MHQISLQQLSNHIKKHVNDWTSSDISHWLSLNQIQIDNDRVLANDLDGDKIMSMSPNDWMDYGVSRYIARQIVQWLEQQVDQFNALVSAKFFQQEHLNQQQIKQSLLAQVELLKQNNQPDNSQQFSKCHRFYDNNIKISEKKQILELPKFQRKIKSYQHLKQQQQQICQRNNNELKFVKCLSLCQNVANVQPVRDVPSKNEGSISSQQKAIQVPLEIVKQTQKYLINQKIDTKSQGVISQQQQQQQLSQQQKSIQKQRINSEITQRRQKKKKRVQKNKNQNINSNQNSDINIKQQAHKQKQIIQNQSIVASKWIKKKKQDSKILNEKIKNKNKEFKDPKLYNYINVQNNHEKNDKNSQKSAEIKGISKRVFSEQQFCPAKMVSPNQRADYKIPVRQNPVTPYSSKPIQIPTASTALQNPMVKFATSQFILCGPEDKKSFLFEKKLKIKYQKVQHLISGSTKIGRLKSNQVVITDQSVSRQHAEIIPFVDMMGKVKFLLKDVGSKFGTFVQFKAMQENVQGKSYLIGDAQIQILNAQPSKPITPLNPPLNRRLKFDLKVRIDRQKDIIIQNRSIITIGKRMGNDIKIETNCAGAKIWYQKQKRVCLEAIQGKLYQKLIQHQPWDIQANANSNGQVQVVFGWLKVNLQVLEFCLVCEAKRKDCQCRNQEEQSKNNGKK